MPGLLRGIARTAVIAGTATAVSNRVSRRQARRWSQQDYDQAEQAAPAEPEPQETPPPGDSMDDRLAQLSKLGELKERGLLSEAEFAEQKQRILGS
jgi:putative oligomerization/nucleic acid binding protein